MVKLVIEADSIYDLEMVTEHVLGLLREGYTSGYEPPLHLETED
jgi:hypothetical protein